MYTKKRFRFFQVTRTRVPKTKDVDYYNS